jgi:ribosomal protein S13
MGNQLAEIIQFHTRQRGSDIRLKTASDVAATGQIVLFTGVRYERIVDVRKQTNRVQPETGAQRTAARKASTRGAVAASGTKARTTT